MMRVHIQRGWFVVGALLLAACLVGPVVAQEGLTGKKILKIRGIKAERLKTAEYQVKPKLTHEIKDWYQIEVEYQTAPEWIDELTFTYYVLLKNDANERPGDPRSSYRLLKGQVANINIADGRHYSVMYLHPRTLERFGPIQRIAVIVHHEGVVADQISEPDSKTRWWEEIPPVEGLLLNRTETPYAMIAYDRYEPIKVGGSRSR